MPSSVQNLLFPSSIRGNLHHGNFRKSSPPSSSFSPGEAIAVENLPRASIAKHAIAYGSIVIGMSANAVKDDGENDEINNFAAGLKGSNNIDPSLLPHWATWQRSFAPSMVHRVESSYSGTVIAVSTSDGCVSLLRGTDGGILAQRVVALANAESPIGINFISAAEHNAARDALVILPPFHSDSSAQTVRPVLVSGINGLALNSQNPAEVANVAKELRIVVIDIDINDSGNGCRSKDEDRKCSSSHIIEINGCFISPTKIRLFAYDVTGVLSVHDFDTSTQKTDVVSSAVQLHDPYSKHDTMNNWICDKRMGIKIDTFHSSRTFVLVSCQCGLLSKICWFDISTLDLVCDYIATGRKPSLQNTTNCPMLMSVEPVKSGVTKGSVAIALVMNHSLEAAGTIIRIVQLVVDEDGKRSVLQACLPGNNHKPSSTSKGEPQIVYEIPQDLAMDQSFVRNVDLAAMDGLYSVKYTFIYDDESQICKEFTPQPSDLPIGKFKFLISSKMFDQADELLAKTNPEQFSSAFGSMHGSEVALAKFKAVLMSGDASSPSNMISAKECLRRLAAGAVSGGERGIHILINASKMVSNWSNEVELSDSNFNPPSVQEFRMALLAISASISEVSDVVSENFISELDGEKQRIDLQISALKTLERAISAEIEIDASSMISSGCSSVTSPVELFRGLVSRGFITMANRVRQYDYEHVITKEVVASSVLTIPLSMDPLIFSKWIRDIAIPGLGSLSHPLVRSIRIWACNAANSYDTNNFARGLLSSIVLLKAICDATMELSTSAFSAHWTRSSSVGDTSPKHSKSSPNDDSRCESLDLSFDSYRSANQSNTSKRKSIEKHHSKSFALLEMAYICKFDRHNRSGETKRVRLSGESYQSISSDFARWDDSIQKDEDDCEIKLHYATILSKARRLGLSHESLSLQSFSTRGVCFIAKELIKIYSSSAPSSNERYNSMMSIIKPFCEEASVKFDEAIVQYSKQLCVEQCDDHLALTEASSLASCCVTANSKCEVGLMVLRGALRCPKPPKSLSILSKNAIEWSKTDEVKRSELEEATRLLAIDSIVRKYCGNGAREFFHISNARHGQRLLQHVCRFVDEPNVFNDALILCDAFPHLSKDGACVMILQRLICAPEPGIDGSKELNIRNAMTNHRRSEQCSNLLRKLRKIDQSLAIDTGYRILCYCCSMITELSTEIVWKQQDEQTVYEPHALCIAACAILEVMQESENDENSSSLPCRSHTKLGAISWTSLSKEIRRIASLQRDYGVYISLSDLRSGSKTSAVLSHLLKPAIGILLRGVNKDDKRHVVVKARRGTEVLLGEDSLHACNQWNAAVGVASCTLIDSSDPSALFSFLQLSGLFDHPSSESASLALVSVFTRLCDKATSFVREITANGTSLCNKSGSKPLIHAMKIMIQAASIQLHAIKSCPQITLSKTTSLISIADLISKILVRADEGAGEELDIYKQNIDKEARIRTEFLAIAKTSRINLNIRIPPRPTLHPTWYVGDGLLLPPLEALAYCTTLCVKHRDKSEQCASLFDSKESFQCAQLLDESFFDFLNGRGAHTLALRLLLTNVASHLSEVEKPDCNKLQTIFDSIMCRLAERSLASDGTGYMNGIIDSQLAVTCLLSLSKKKLAFKVFRSTLPASISKRDFGRVVTLACVGIRTARGGKFENLGWKGQEIFQSQCMHLASNARWWAVLKHYGVTFDPRLFSEEQATSETTAEKLSQSSTSLKAMVYAASLIPVLICNASKVLVCSDGVLDLAKKFGTAFGADPHLAAQRHVEFLLACPTRKTNDNNENSQVPTKGRHADVRADICRCDVVARKSLSFLPSPKARSSILRRCLIKLEESKGSRKDYERHSMILSLYYRELSIMTKHYPNLNETATQFMRDECERIERRKDALAVLASFFTSETPFRPDFPAFFQPLPSSLDSNKSCPKQKLSCSLIECPKNPSEEHFDPLLSLQSVLDTDPSYSTATALDPLCVSLSIPSGYIHSRSLCARFAKAKEVNSTLPLFETAVLPVLQRLESAKDAAELAEWCASQYEDGKKERLDCLDKGHDYSLKASREVERKRHISSDESNLLVEERQALERVKRVGRIFSGLGDLIKVERILNNSPSHQVQRVLSKVICRVKQKKAEENMLSPEKFVEYLLTEASMEVATASLDTSQFFTMEDFYLVSKMVHEACSFLSDAYSHVHAGVCARILARRWLVHGDEVDDCAQLPVVLHKKDALIQNLHTSETTASASGSTHTMSASFFQDDDDTGNFVMDLNAFGTGQEVWSDDVGSGISASTTNRNVSKCTEQCFKRHGSLREVADYGNARTALRVAFVVSFAQDYFGQSITNNVENHSGSLDNECQSQMTYESESSPQARYTKNSEAGDQSDPIINHARELLRIVFAKSSRSGSKKDFSATTNERQKTSSNQHPLQPIQLNQGNISIGLSKESKTITFAMRHRALRTASILCPHKVLESVILTENYFGDKRCTLDKCKFGSYLAMEIEAMGLPLPHSDLIQLSMMHYSSYARALWRHHGQSGCGGYKGRLLHLLIELCTMNNRVDDESLVFAVLNELTKVELPRTLLSACEIVGSLHNDAGTNVSGMKLNDETSGIMIHAIHEASRMFLGGLGQIIKNDTVDTKECLRIVRKLGQIVGGFGILSVDHISRFAVLACGLAGSAMTKHQALSAGLLQHVVMELVCRLPQGTSRSDILLQITTIDGGISVLRRCQRSNNSRCPDNEPVDGKYFVSSLVENIELSLSREIDEICKKSAEEEMSEPYT